MSAPDALLSRLFAAGFSLVSSEGRYRFTIPDHADPDDVEAAHRYEDAVDAYWRAPMREMLPLVRDSRAELSPAQARAVAPGARRPEPYLLLDVVGPLSTLRLKAALGVLVARHEILRTRFVTEGTQILQQVDPPFTPDLTVVHLPYDVPPEAPVARAVRRRTRVVDAPGFPWQALLLRYGPTRHVLWVRVHDVLLDGNAMAAFTAHLVEAYVTAARPCKRPLKPIGYLTYVAWLRTYWGGGRLQAQLAWWKERLAHLPEASVLPVDKAGLSLQAYREGRHHFRLNEAQARALANLAQRTGHRLKTVLLSAWVALLSRYQGTGDLPVGVACDNRDHAAWRHALGNFENLVILRCDVSGGPSFRDLMAQVAHTARQVSACGYAPLQQVAENLLGTEEGLDYPVRGAFGFHARPGPFQREGLSFGVRSVVHSAQGKDISMVLAYGRREIHGCIAYHAGKYDPGTIGRLVDYFTHLTAVLPAHLDSPVHALPLLRPDAAARLLRAWQGEPTPRREPADLAACFAARAARRATAPALRTVADPMLGNLSLEYALLDDWANRIAASLRVRGVTLGTPVGVFLHGTADAVAVLIGITRAGGTYVPLDPRAPAERIAAMMHLSGMRRLITRAALRDRLPQGVGDVDVWLTDEGDTLAGEAHAPPMPAIPDDLPAYVMFTSGSTGIPKGVTVSHANLRSLIDDLGPLALDTDSVVLQASSLAFDAAGYEIWGTLCAGGTLVVPGDHSLDDLPELLRRQAVNTLFLGSHLFRYMVDGYLDVLRAVPRVISGGDVLPPLQVARFLEACPDSLLFNGYGPTEATTFTTCCNLRIRGLTPHSAPIGRPLKRRTVFLLDALLQPVPPGVRGEIFIGGEGLALGYLKQPGLTAARFLPNPFAREGEAGSRLYRTGDQARHLADGSLEFLARSDHGVKIHGYLVEPTEVATMILMQPEVQQALVLPRPDGAGQRQLVAYVRPVAGIDPADADEKERLKRLLIDALGRRLPTDLVPLAVVVLERFPLATSGKIDLRALPNPVQGTGTDAARTLRGQRGHRLAHLCAEVLGLDYDHLRDQVGAGLAHSPARLLERLRLELGLDLGSADMADVPAAEVARYMALLPDPSTHDETWDFDAFPFRDAGPLSLEQRAFLQQSRADEAAAAAVDGRACNLALSVHLLGRLSPARWLAAGRGLCARHAVLRTVFPPEGGMRVRAEAGEINRFLDVTGLPRDVRESVLSDLFVREARRPFNPAERGGFRCLTARLGDGEHRLLLVAHRAVADEETLAMLPAEWAELYGRPEGDGPDEPYLQYGQYAACQAHHLADWTDSANASPRRQLQNATLFPRLVAEVPRPADGREGGDHFFHIPDAACEALRSLSRRSGSPLSVVCHAAFALLLGEYAGETALVIGMRTTNRGSLRLAHTAGPLANTLPLKLNLQGDPVFWEVTAALRELVRDARAYGHIPFPLMAAEEPSLRGLPMCPIVFAWGMQLEAHRMYGLQIKPAWFPHGSGVCDLFLNVAETDGGLAGHFAYRTTFLDGQTVQRMSDQYRNLLEQIAARPDDPVSKLSLLDAAHKDALLRVWNDTGGDSPRDRSLPRQFEDTAARMPHSEALRTPAHGLAEHRGRFSYARLNRLANHLAAHLTARGLRGGMPVACCQQIGPAAVVTVLAVLKTGGVLVPLTLDAEAVTAEVLARSGAAFLLTDSPDAFPAFDGVRIAPRSFLALPEGMEEPANPADTVRPTHDALLLFPADGGPPTPVSHHALSNATALYKTLREGGSTLLYAALHETACLHEMFSAWCGGGRLVVYPRGRLSAPASLLKICHQEDVTRLFLPHVAFKQLARYVGRTSVQGGVVADIIVSGDVPRPEAEAAVVRAALGGARVIYRLDTPRHVGVATCSDDEVRRDIAHCLPGRPAENLQLYLLDRFLRPVPVGAVGRLFLGGVAVPRCLPDAPRTSALRLVPDPYGQGREGHAPGARLEDTGLVARWASGRNGLPGGLILEGAAEDRVLLGHRRINLYVAARVLAAHADVTAARLNLTENGRATEADVWVDAETCADARFFARLETYARARLPAEAVPCRWRLHPVTEPT